MHENDALKSDRMSLRPAQGHPPMQPALDTDHLFYCVIGDRHAAIDCLLQDDFLNVVGSEAAFDKRRAHMLAKFTPLSERDLAAPGHNALAAALVVHLMSPPIIARAKRESDVVWMAASWLASRARLHI